MDMNQFDQHTLDNQVASNRFMSKVFGWMFLGLFITGFAAYYVASTPSILYSLYTTGLVFGLLIAEVILVAVLSRMVTKMSFATAAVMFIAYAIVNGITLSSIFLIYDIGSITTVFFGTALIFGVMAVYGYVTKVDLSAFRAFLMIGLIGIIVMTLINLFLRSDQLMMLISYVGIAIFAGLTAYDIQKLKNYYNYSTSETGTENKFAIIGALTLYLDFINLFLYLIRLLGKKK